MVMALKNKQAFIDTYRKKITPEKPYEDLGENWPDTEEFLSGQSDDEMSDADNDFLNPPHEDDESPLKRALRKRMSAK